MIFFILLGGFAALVTAIWLLFDKAEEVFLPSKKAELANWLTAKQLTPLQISNWAQLFTELIDKVFSKNHFSMKCYLMSLLFSVMWTLVFAGFFYSIHPLEFESLVAEDNDFYWHLYVYFFLTVFVNGTVDFFSFWQTRRLVSYSTNFDLNLRNSMVLLVLDVMLTFVLFVALWVLSSFLISFIKYIELFVQSLFASAPSEFSKLTIDTVISDTLSKAHNTFINVVRGPLFEPGYKIGTDISIFFYSTLFSSIWLWLYIISVYCVRMINSTSSIFFRFSKSLHIQQKPIKSIGYIFLVIAIVVYVIVSAAILIFV